MFISCILCMYVTELKDLVEGLEEAIDRHRSDRRVPPLEMHAQVKQMYRWEDVAARTEKVCIGYMVKGPLSIE